MKKLLLIALALCLLGLVFFSHLRLALFTGFFLRDLLDEKSVSDPAQGYLARATALPVIEALRIPGRAGTIIADLYRPKGSGKRAAIQLTHGIIETGKDDPRLVRFAHLLARAGFVVMVPELRGMKSLRILLSDIEDIVASFRYLVSLREIVDERKLGLLGFSYAAGPTLIAAAHPSIRDRVKFVVSFGGYFDPVNVIRYMTTGYYEYKEVRGVQEPEPYGKWVFFKNNLDYVEDLRERRLFEEIFAREEQGRRMEAGDLARGLSTEGQALYALLVNQDPERVEMLVTQIYPQVRHYLRRLSLEPYLPSVKAYLIVGHGSADPLIPYTESLRLAAAVRDQARIHTAILKQFAHVDPAQKKYPVKDYLTVYLPSMAQFYWLVYDLLRQQL